MELQRGFAKLEQNQRMELKKAAQKDYSASRRDRGLAEQPRMMYDGKAGAPGRAAADGAAGMPAEFRLSTEHGEASGSQTDPWPPMPVRVFAHARAAGPAEDTLRLRRDALLASGPRAAGRQGGSVVRPVRFAGRLRGDGVRPHARRPARFGDANRSRRVCPSRCSRARRWK